jgi:hypothetical protein
MTHRPEDRNAHQQWMTWPGGATLAELEGFVRALREIGAPDDAHPVVKVNEHGELVSLVCVTSRAVAMNVSDGVPTTLRANSVITVTDLG